MHKTVDAAHGCVVLGCGGGLAGNQEACMAVGRRFAPWAVAGATDAGSASCEAIEQCREALPVLTHLPGLRSRGVWLHTVSIRSCQRITNADGSTQLRRGCLQVRQPPRHALQQLHSLPEAAGGKAAGRQSLHPLRHELCARHSHSSREAHAFRLPRHSSKIAGSVACKRTT